MSPLMGSKRRADSGELERGLAALPGVREVDLSRYPAGVSLTVDPAATAELARETVRSVLKGTADVEPEVTIVLDEAPESRPERRSRFDRIEVSSPERGRVEARVTLEWDGKVWEGVAEGVQNPASELRVCASATLRAVERIADQRASFSVIGVKELRVFDHDLVVVLVHSAQLDESRFIGIAMITEDRQRAAAMAALNATNRVVGRFLQT
jgi:hypothetical protein